VAQIINKANFCEINNLLDQGHNIECIAAHFQIDLTLARPIKKPNLNNAYLSQGILKVQLLGRGFAWLDTETHKSLMEAGAFIEIIEKRQRLKLGCIEGSLSRDFISRNPSRIQNQLETIISLKSNP
jgi:hypothetical protein